MSKELVISANRHETRVALLEDDQLVEVYFQRSNEYSLAGSIHKGRVTRVLPGMQSAFVDRRPGTRYVPLRLGLPGRAQRRHRPRHRRRARSPGATRGPQRKGGREGRSEGGREGGRDRGRDRSRGGRDRDREARPAKRALLPPQSKAAPADAPALEGSPAPSGEQRPAQSGDRRDDRGGRRGRRRGRGRSGFPESKYALPYRHRERRNLRRRPTLKRAQRTKPIPTEVGRSVPRTAARSASRRIHRQVSSHRVPHRPPATTALRRTDPRSARQRHPGRSRSRARRTASRRGQTRKRKTRSIWRNLP